VSLVSSMLKVPKPAASPAASWTSASRIASAATLVLSAAASFCSQPSSTFPLSYARYAHLLDQQADEDSLVVPQEEASEDAHYRTR
jgi:hypothetical protein